MQLILVLICFNYSLLRNLKDSIVITNSGAEVIPIIKMWVLLPMAIAMTMFFSKLSNRYSQERVFYIMISIFLVFFALFGYVLYPFREWLHPHESAIALKAMLPESGLFAVFHWFVALYEHWIYTLFYVMAELWAAMILNVCFWGFANEITRVDEARRFYGVFGIGSNLAATLAGLFSILFVTSNGFSGDILSAALTEEASEAIWQQQLGFMMTVVVVSGLITVCIFRWMSQNVLTAPCFNAFHETKRQAILKGKGKKLSLLESFGYLKNSKYLQCIAVMVVAYNLSIHLVELVWKDQLKQLYPAKADYMTALSYVTFSMGIIATLTAFVLPRIITRLGWTFTALITPGTMLITSVSFFAFLFFKDEFSPMLALLGTTPLAIAVYIGFAQNCFSKAAKYSVFDATKEMSFIPLDHESKLKGKAAIDGVGSRLGKSGGSLIHTGLLMGFHTLSASSPYVAVILMAVIIGWTFAVRELGHKFGALASDEAQPSASPATVSVLPSLTEERLVNSPS